MENKYFTPDIEDFYVGVAYEKFSQGLQMDEFGRFLPEETRDDEVKWREGVIKYPSDILHLKIALDKETVRVPYLTKEQIEAEGFVYRGKISHGTIPSEPFTKIELEFIKNNILIKLDIISNKVMIDKADSTEENVNFYNVKTLYHGECKDINTFRKIIKLLGI